VSGNVFENPAEVAGVIGRQAQLGVVGHDFSQAVEGFARHDPAFVLPAFWPRIREQDEHAVDRCRRQRLREQSRVIGKDPNIVEPTLLDLGEQFDCSVLEYFAADKPGLRMLLGQLCEMLATAETDLEPNRGSRGTEESICIEATRCWEVYRQPRQQFVDEGLLSGTQSPPAAAAEDLMTPLRLAAGFVPQKARRSSSTRSSRSQEKPPSGSGRRPKWP
jgi:hypothetical protein